jgi:hypothetical protein
MSKDSLVWSYYVAGAVAWACADDDDEGGIIGERRRPDVEGDIKRALEKRDLDELESAFVEREAAAVAAEFGEDVARHTMGGWIFGGKAAKVALKRMKAALAEARRVFKSGSDPWPAWAVTAKAAGWTPPDGWKP